MEISSFGCVEVKFKSKTARWAKKGMRHQNECENVAKAMSLAKIVMYINYQGLTTHALSHILYIHISQINLCYDIGPTYD